MSNQIESEIFVVIFFEVDNTYMVIEKSKLSNYDEENKTAMVYFPKSKKYYSGLVKKEGSKRKCEKRCQRLIESQKTDVTSTEDENRQINHTSPKKSKSKSADDILSNEFEKLTQLSKKRTREPSIEKSETEELFEEMIENKSILSDLVKNNGNRPSEEGKKQVMYNNKNLVDVSASSTAKYVTQVMDILFTKDELSNGYIIEGSSRSKREALDLSKIELLRDAFFIKFNICESKQSETYDWIKTKAKRKCLDTKTDDQI
ncbi:unnamed protein product [Brachionus calyciflorus]|uniref:BEN domain-containing protein n=1 Tax=Brachionus calyciflorus TaxID=104777 RepID=A0A813TX01_9BILA|nr:unnamed protein product [Brachionus calyciflorus]